MNRMPRTYTNQLTRDDVENMHPDAVHIEEQASGWIVFFSTESYEQWLREMSERKNNR